MAVNRDIRVPYSGVVERTQQVLPAMDTARAAGLAGLLKVHVAKSTGQARELVRLRDKFGNDHPRVVALEQKITTHGLRTRQMGAETERASTPVVQPDADAWILHGRVRDQHLVGLSQVAVALFDESGGKRLVAGATEDTGYFKLTVPMATWERFVKALGDKGRAKKDPGELFVYLHVLGGKRAKDQADSRALQPSGGHVDYLEVVLSAGKGRDDAQPVRGRARDA